MAKPTKTFIPQRPIANNASAQAQKLFAQGFALYQEGQLAEAQVLYEEILRLQPKHFDALHLLGVIAAKTKNHKTAVELMDKAIAVNQNAPAVYSNRGIALHELKQFDAALASYDKAIAIKPDYDFLYGMRLHTKMLICDWDEAETQCVELENKIKCNGKASLPFPVLSIKDSLSLQRKTSEIYVQQKCPVNHSLGAISKHPRRDKIRIGYFSADFHNRATDQRFLFDTIESTR
ncbi:MAG TPA: tetratricopeptide repeat protein [Syntrophorhabdales bacterium]|nr:tetratricopeptide repeat protein [Syntrophorhabdales bacterium]